MRVLPAERLRADDLRVPNGTTIRAIQSRHEDIVGVDEGEDLSARGIRTDRLAGLARLAGVLDDLLDAVLAGNLERAI